MSLHLLAPPLWMNALVAVVLMTWLGALSGPVRRAAGQLGRTAGLELLGVLALGVGVRLVAAPKAMAPVPDLFITRSLLLTGLRDPHPIYGWGIGGLGALLRALTGAWPEGWLTLNLLAACAAPPLAWAAARALSPPGEGDFAGRVAGLLTAVLAPSVLLAASYSEHTLLASLLLGATAAALGATRLRSGWLSLNASLTAAFACHLRPEALPVAGILLAHAAWSARRVGPVGLAGAALAAAVVGARALDLAHLDTAGRVLGESGSVWETAFDLLSASSWAAPGTRTSFNGLASPWLVPLGAWPLALLGGLRCAQRRRWLLPILWCVAWLPVCLRGRPLSDMLRMQLPSLLLAMPLVGLGAQHLRRWFPGVRRWLLPAWAVLCVPMLVRDAQPWMATQVGRTFVDGAASVPPDVQLLVPAIDAYSQPQADLANLVAGRRGRGHTLGADAPRPAGSAWIWWGVQCADEQAAIFAPVDRWACERVRGCRGAPARVVRARGRVEPTWPARSADLTIGWYELGDCPPLNPPAPPPATPPPAGRSSGP